MSNEQNTMMYFHVPTDETLLTTVGLIALRHSHLEHILRMTIKSLTGVGLKVALDATAFESSASLRKRILKLGKRRLGEGSAYVQLQAMLERCRRASKERNELMHNIWAQQLDGPMMVRTSDHEWKPIPTIEKLKNVETNLKTLTEELNFARLEGFLAKAMAQRDGIQAK